MIFAVLRIKISKLREFIPYSCVIQKKVLSLPLETIGRTAHPLFMDIYSILNSIIHSEKKFFPPIIQMADYIVEGANLLTDMISMENDKFKQEEIYNQIKDLETRCDELSTSLFDDLNASLITPLDRTDLHQLCDALDDVMDNINASAKRMLLYHPEDMAAPTMHLAEIVIECAKSMGTAAGALYDIKRHPQQALTECGRLHDLEHEGDDVYGDYIEELFNSDMDAKEVIKMKEIMGSLESATDCANKVGKTLKTIIVKYQ